MIRIKESDDREYLKELIAKQEAVGETIDVALSLIVKLWVVYSDEVRSGVGYITKIEDKYYFEAYKDFSVKNGIKNSQIAAELMLAEIKKITDVVYSIHRESNKVATVALLSYGFKITNDYLFFKKEL